MDKLAQLLSDSNRQSYARLQLRRLVSLVSGWHALGRGRVDFGSSFGSAHFCCPGGGRNISAQGKLRRASRDSAALGIKG